MNSSVVHPSQMQPVYNDFIKHSLLIASSSWTNVSPLFSVISNDIMASFFSLSTGTPIGNKIKNFRYFTSKIKLTFMVQGFPLAYGKLVFYADPMPYDMSNGGIMPALSMMKAPQKCRSMLIPHVVIDPSKTQAYELILDCPTPWGCYSLDYVLGSYRLGYQIINPLLSGQTGAPPSIAFSIYMSLVDPEMSVLTFTSKTLTEKEQAKTSTHVKSFSDGMAMMSSIPVLGPFATIASTVSSVAANALAWFGFSRPVVEERHNVGVFYSCQENGLLDGKLFSHNATMRTENSVTINPKNIPLCSYEDQEIEGLANKYSFIRTFNITNAMASATQFAVLYLHPQNIYVTDSPAVVNGYEPSTLNLVTRGFHKYRCDYKVRLEFVASVFHRCTVVVAYFPDYLDTGVSMANAVQTVKNWQFQIAGNAVYDLEIPHSQPDPFLDTFRAPNGGGATAGTSNGILVCYVLNPNISNGTGDIYMNFYMAGCNLSMGCPSNHASGYSISLTSAIAPANLTNPLCIKDPNFYQQYFGEECPHTTKELAGRSVPYVRILQNSGTPRTGKCYTAALPVIAPAASGSGMWVTNYSAQANTFSLLSASYLGYKGSTHIAVWPDTYPSGAKTVIASRYNYSTSGVLDLVSASTLFANNDQNTVSTVYSDTQNYIDIKLPYYYKGMFRPTFPIPITPAANHVLQMNFAATTNVQTDPDIQTYFHAGDDFNFVFFRGTPVTIMV